MATRSNNSKTSVPKKRLSSRKSTSKKETKEKRKKRVVKQKIKKSDSTKLLFFFLILFGMAILVGFGYYLGKNDKQILHTVVKKTFSRHKEAVEKKPLTLFSKVETKKPHTKKVFTPVVKRRESHLHIPKQEKKKVVSHSKKAKLVIIIDDISTMKQLQSIKSLPIPVTPSIFPPFARAMHSNTLARGLKHYMVHLPMESGNRRFNRQYKTLRISFSKAQMEARIKEIRRLFPTARYINNHTGSVFTNNTKAMKMLYGIMKKEGFRFIDSRTIGSSKVKKIAHIYGDTYISRDIFIDNIQTVSSIHRQLKKAVQIAKKRGYAIAIGHPRKTTIQALSSAQSIFKDIDLVYIDEIYK